MMFALPLPYTLASRTKKNVVTDLYNISGRNHYALIIIDICQIMHGFI